MRAVIQRTLKPAEVKVDKEIKGKIEKGLVVYLGIEETDTIDDIIWLSKKIIQMRIFGDLDGKMNLSVNDINGGLLIISQFTLYASTKKGNRPSFIRSAKPDFALSLYDKFIDHISTAYSLDIQKGVFGADMKVSYINDGPVTIFMDSKNKE